MTHNVLHRGYGITIDLGASDLGHPDRPGLLQEIHRNYKPDLLYCLGASSAITSAARPVIRRLLMIAARVAFPTIGP
jgi:hypothetical protein